ncbi:aldo/keto reductase [Arthrobacter sp. NamB2]|uniref:aldo/keto reductase n=1 Tax=Arthrobacter sp. NamB2 TaxID=2576035 RepID=UPI0010C9B89D|nr:aldo/keto reductase [Arthrobacter sp. NamB2]TKV27343.1 aldo/keto reductase [Arthrobacter sp. NamB2]
MQTRTLANGLALTELGLGTAQFGNLYRETTDAEAEGAFEAAWQAGIRSFDTAPHYGLGLSERRLGALLRTKDRDDFVLSTKAGRLLVPNPGGEGQRDTDSGYDVPATLRRQWDFSADGIKRSIDESLERLGLDRIDIVYLHDPDDHGGPAMEEALPALLRLREAGVITAIGAGMNQSAMPAEFIRRYDIDVVMLAGRYTLLEQGALADLMPLAVDRGVGVIIAGVYNSGLLSRDRPRSDAKYNYETAPAELVARAHRIADICERHGVSLPDAAVAFPLRHPATVSVVVGGRTDEQVRGSVERYLRPIPDALWDDLRHEGLIPQ